MKKPGRITLRITSGFLKNRKIQYKYSDALRATSSKLRQSVFNSLGNNLDNLSFLDLCSGSGINGFEALSRGADYICLVDINLKLKKDYLNNIESLSLIDKVIEIKNLDVVRYLNSTTDSFDVIYLDPPFQKNNNEADKIKLYYETISIIHRRKILKSGGTLIVEYYKKFPLDIKEINFRCIKSKCYGSIGINFFQ